MVCRPTADTAITSTPIKCVRSFVCQRRRSRRRPRHNESLAHYSLVIPLLSTRYRTNHINAPTTFKRYFCGCRCSVNFNSLKVILTLSSPVVPNGYTTKCSKPYWSITHHFYFFDVRALWRSVLSARVPERQKK